MCTPDQVIEKLMAFREEVGAFGTLLYAGHDWVDPSLAKESMRLMAKVVVPAINAAGAGRAEKHAVAAH